MEYGLIGEHLLHSCTKTIHEKIASYKYDLHKVQPDETDAFLRAGDFKGINLSIPYTETVIPCLDEISDHAREIGAVDTVVNRDGKLYGYNTDYLAMRDLLEQNGTDPSGKKVLILGSGAAARTARAAVTDLGAAEAVISCGEACESHADAEIIINTTDCGMAPDLDQTPLKLDPFTKLSGLVDTICDPLRTALVLEAQKRGIPAQGGLYMAVMSAVHACELFTDCKIDCEVSDRVYQEILNSRRNIVLTGMSLAGKTTLGTLLSQKLGRKLEDTDQMIIRREQRAITDIFATDGEPYFRDLETSMCRELSAEKGMVIATGGGAILRPENVDALKKNGFIVFLDRPFDQILPASDRPLADTKEKVASLLKKRYPIYRSTCDGSICNDMSPEDGAEKICSMLKMNC